MRICLHGVCAFCLRLCLFVGLLVPVFGSGFVVPEYLFVCFVCLVCLCVYCVSLLFPHLCMRVCEQYQVYHILLVEWRPVFLNAPANFRLSEFSI